MSNTNFNNSEKIFSFFCVKNRTWGNADKEVLNAEELFNTQRKEWEIFWKKFEEKSMNFECKVIIDYGCGYGFDSLFMLKDGAEHIYCLEISQERLDASRDLHTSHGYKNVTYIDNTVINDLQNKVGKGKVDIIVCRDVMEHIPFPYEALKSMYDVLKKWGEAYIGFAPLYKSPYGSHFSAYCKIPWIHLFFSEQTILNVFKELYQISETISSYQDIPGSGVNKLSYYNYLEMIKKFNWDIEKKFVNRLSNHRHLAKILNILISLLPSKSIKEFFIIGAYTKIRKL